MGRKNWLFCDSVEGADASATIYSIVETAKANGQNIYKYLVYLLEHRPNDDMTEDELEHLMPWSSEVNKACSIDQE